MQNQLAAIELRVLVGEFQQLVGSRLDQVYDLAGSVSENGKRLVLQLSISESKHRDSPGNSNQLQSNKCFFACVAPFAVFSSASRPETVQGPGSFCSLLRHHLENAKLISISQLGCERILELVFSSGNSRQLRLIFELFSKGNVILVDEKSVIIGAAESQSWKDRTVRPGFAYSLPPAFAGFAALSEEQFLSAVLSSEKDSVVKALAVDLGLSGAYAEELCTAASIDKAKSPALLSPGELKELYSALQKLLSRKPEPIAILDSSGRVAVAFPFKVAASAGLETKPFQSFSQAVESVMVSRLESSISSSRESSSSKRIKEVEFTIGQQKAAIGEMEKAAKENTRAAELIYEHYLAVKQVLDDYNRLRKTFTKEQLREYFASNSKIKDIDEKTGTITIELG